MAISFGDVLGSVARAVAEDYVVRAVAGDEVADAANMSVLAHAVGGETGGRIAGVMNTLEYGASGYVGSVIGHNRANGGGLFGRG